MHGTVPTPRRRRPYRRDDSWTFIESELLRQHWPDVALIRQHLPHRTPVAVRNMAKRCGLIPDKVQHIWTGKGDRTLTRMLAEGAHTVAIAVELGLTAAQVRNRIHYKGIRSRRRPVLYGEPLVDAIRQRAFDRHLSLLDLDRSLGKTKTFSSYCRRNGASPAAIDRATKALGGRLTIVWEDDE